MRFIKLDGNNKVIAIRIGKTAVDGEIQSNIGEVGQIMRTNGTFYTPEQDLVEQQPSIEDKINYIYYKEMGVI